MISKWIKFHKFFNIFHKVNIYIIIAKIKYFATVQQKTSISVFLRYDAKQKLNKNNYISVFLTCN